MTVHTNFMAQTSFELIQTLKTEDSLESIEDSFTAHIRKLGFDRYFYFNKHIDNPDIKSEASAVKKAFPVCSFPVDFLELYQQKDYGIFDPVVKYLRKNGLSVEWRFIAERCIEMKEKEVIARAADYNLVAGVSVPIMGKRGLVGGFTIAHEKAEGFYEYAASRFNKVCCATLILFNYCNQILNYEPLNTLTDRQIDVFRWLAEGLSSKQIACRMKIQEDTVNKHIKEGKSRLKAATRIEAIIKLVKASLIEV